MNIDASDLPKLAVTLRAAPHRVGAEVARFTRQTAIDIETDARRNAPVVSGTLRRSITHRFSGDGRAASMSAIIGTDVAYARRIEFGFVGADSLGRVYNQAPQPYLGPAFDKHVRTYRDGIARLAGQATLG
ncbi:HK97 gp10 family phage protein [Phytoactinopolyspora limicola]|uniref:HK97 gp10 family phage protein n=1 Tax=Phytoactinopolyspora limicola TaxID=2715536 RepID=UPI00140D0ABE|nr:HK97 gp10 family phage protein [Phytoactinopolyspora limicola]